MKLLRRDRAAHTDEAPEPAASEATGSAGGRRTLRADRGTPSTTAMSEEPGPAPAPPAGEIPPDPERRKPKGRIRALFDEQVTESRAEAEQVAAMELRQFMEPARQQLLLNVPGSSSPEEAEAMLAGQAALVLNQPVDVSPDMVVDLRNPSSMGAYPPAEKLSNRVLRLADRHWAKEKVRTAAEIVAEKSALADEEFARKPAGTQRCFALRGSLRCRGVFTYHADDLAGDTLLACPSCGTAHSWDPDQQTWTLRPDAALANAPRRGALTSPS